jgi:multiple sugar transport system ATP-binding protein
MTTTLPDELTTERVANERVDGASPPAIELLGVTKRYGATTALVELSLSVGSQEFLVLLGPSGCGKSTLLKIIAGLEDATEGEIYIAGRLVNYVPPKARNVAMVFQNYALYPHMTVEQNLAFPLKMNRRPKEEIRRRVSDAARLLGLESLVARYPEQLSGGQRQRVALGRAIVRDPVAYLMDEPLSNLDALLRTQTRDELMKLHRRVGRTTVYVTHDQVEAMTMADRIVVLKEGVVQQIGAPQAVYRRPLNTFVAGFIGSPQMNLFPGRFEDGRFAAPDLNIPLGNRVQDIPAGEGTLGIRAEDVSLVPPGTAGALPGRVSLIEPIGSDVFLNVALNADTACVVRVGADTELTEGEPVHLSFTTEKLHLFDATGNRLPDA